MACQAFGATYAAFVRDAGVDGTTIGINSQKQIEALPQGLQFFSGETYYVDSVNGADNRSGKSWNLAVATLGQAHTLAAAAISAGTDKGIPIAYLRETHAETYTLSNTAPTLSTTGFTIIGLNRGTSRPTFTFSTNSLTNDIDFSGANIALVSLRFVGNVEGLGGTTGGSEPLDVGAANLHIIDCEFTNASLAVTRWIGADGNADGLTIIDCKNTTLSNTTANVAFVTFSDTTDSQITDVVISGNSSFGGFSVGNIQIVNGSVTRARIEGNRFENGSAVDVNIELSHAGNSGWVVGNWLRIATDRQDSWINPIISGMSLFENYGSSDASSTALVIPSQTTI